jgi:transmembrane sensor
MTADLEERRRVAEQAAFWVLTLQDEAASPAERAALIDWLRESPLHISELLRALQLHSDLTNFKDWHQIPRLTERPPAGIGRLPDHEHIRSGRRPPRRLWSAGILAAGIAALCVLGLLGVMRWDTTVLRTQPGERREMTLADGSLVDLAPDSEVAVRYRAHERLITLRHGEALFHVASNPERPFIVLAALTRVRAVGTVFNVESGEQGVSVTVVEGRVAVSRESTVRPSTPGAPAAAGTLFLGADENVSISPAGRATAVHKVSSQAAVAWASGQLVFHDETIAEIARRFNLHNRVQIQVPDAGLAARRLSGVFQATDPESFVAFLQSVADVQVTRSDPTHVTLAMPADGAAAEQH